MEGHGIAWITELRLILGLWSYMYLLLFVVEFGSLFGMILVVLRICYLIEQRDNLQESPALHDYYFRGLSCQPI